MKRLQPDEVLKKDSSQATIDKWDALFREALPRLGYKQELIDEMYPYEAGIPMNDGSTQAVSPKTGRAFFLMSDADKLAFVLSAFTNGYEDYSSRDLRNMIAWFLGKLVMHEGIAEKFFIDKTEAEITDIKSRLSVALTAYSSTNARTLISSVPELLDTFCDNSDMMYYTLVQGDRSYVPHILKDDEKELFKAADYTRLIRKGASSSNSYSKRGTLFALFRPWDDSYENIITRDLVLEISQSIAEQADDKLRAYLEVYLQDYLVLSLNPIDKFMCSTKQAFSSCMSIAKQDDSNGTASTPAFGLPSLFRSDGVFMLFMTPGVSKNMYWEHDEWVKEGTARNKDKAYKYLKMTCRSLTYKGVPTDQVGKRLTTDEKEEMADALMTPRLYVGRQYSARGEDTIWQALVELIMARAGIATSMGFADDMFRIHLSSGFSHLSNVCYLKEGKFVGKLPLAIDAVGKLRGIYYDNLLFNWTTEHTRLRNGYSVGSVDALVDYTQINVGTSRHGSCGVSQISPKSGLDMFKMMMGTQDLSYLHNNLKICKDCGKFITGTSSTSFCTGDDGEGNYQYICKECAETKGYKYCEDCREWYSEKDADKHEVIDFLGAFKEAGFDEPKNMTEAARKALKICRTKASMLFKRREDGSYKSTGFCVHCGSLSTGHEYYKNTRVAVYTGIEYQGCPVTFKICGKCLRSAVMCEKCKRLYFLDDFADAMVLLPNKRVICPRCLDKIRLKETKKKNIRNVLSDLATDPGKVLCQEQADDSEENTSATLSQEVADIIARELEGTEMDHVTKDVGKQINSYLSSPTVEASFPDIPHIEVTPEVVMEEV